MISVLEVQQAGPGGGGRHGPRVAGGQAQPQQGPRQMCPYTHFLLLTLLPSLNRQTQGHNQRQQVTPQTPPRQLPK